MKTRTDEQWSRLWTWLSRREERAWKRAVKCYSAIESRRWRNRSDQYHRILMGILERRAS